MLNTTIFSNVETHTHLLRTFPMVAPNIAQRHDVSKNGRGWSIARATLLKQQPRNEVTRYICSGEIESEFDVDQESTVLQELQAADGHSARTPARNHHWGTTGRKKNTCADDTSAPISDHEEVTLDRTRFVRNRLWNGDGSSHGRESISDNYGKGDVDEFPRYFNDVPFSRRGVILPHGWFRSHWDLFIAALLLYVGIFVPYRISFLGNLSGPMDKFELFVDISFLTDMVLNFFTGKKL